MKALILAAGFGTRLYPLTKDTPKPLLKIGKRYLADYLVEKFEKIKDINEVLIVTNQKFYKNFLDWLKKRNFGKRLKILNDGTQNLKESLGAIGDMRFSIEKAKVAEDLIIIGGDTFLEDNLSEFYKFAKSKSPSISVGLYRLNRKDDVKKYSVVKVDRDLKIIYYREKPKKVISDLIGICLYYFPKERFSLLGEYLSLKKMSTDAPGNLISWLYRKIPTYGFEFRGFWLDVGHPDTYKKVKEALEKNG